MDTTRVNTKIQSARDQIENKGGREVRTAGTPQRNGVDRELSRGGYNPRPDDIPKQDVKVSRLGGRLQSKIKGNVEKGFIPTSSYSGERYKIGSRHRPHNLTHDDGFSKFPKHDPEISDYMNLIKWNSMLLGAQKLRPDLFDATEAYEHFLNGDGQVKTFSYDRYVDNDMSEELH